MELSSHSPSLICAKCKNNLAISVRLKQDVKAADEFFRSQTYEDEKLLWISSRLKLSDVDVVKIEDLKTVIEDIPLPVEINATPDFFDDLLNLYNDDDFNKSEKSDNVDDFTFELEKSKKKQVKRKNYALKFKCWCGKGFHSTTRLEQHDTLRHKVLTDADYLPCPTCGKKFKTQFCVDRHVKASHHDTKEAPKKVSCSVCGSLFVKGSLRQHEARHFRQKQESSGKTLNFYCDLCGRTAKEKQYILTHIERVHLKLKK